ncbi:MAG: class B sortase [Anaerococcus sp.]|nr:class B sortase [Anaerococcus sp.]
MKNKVISGIRFLLILIIIACLAILGKRGYDYWTNAQNNKHIQGLIEESKSEVVASADENSSKDQEDPEADFKKLEEQNLYLLKKFKEENLDVVAIVEIPGTDIKYPILQANDNDYYLRRGLNEEYDIAGSIFMDANNEPDFTDDNTVIYGHHLEIDSMFTPLDQYRDEEFAKNHRRIYITTEEGLMEYEVFSAYGIPADYDYRSLDFAYEADKIDYFNTLKANSEVDLDLSSGFTSDDSIITLSTCEYDYDDQRLAIQAVRVK